MTGKEKYSNFLSWLTMRSHFNQQFVVPESLPKKDELFFKFYEKFRMKIDISDIKIEKPIFIISLPRTGSSMLQDLLSKHPDLSYITHLMHKYYPYFCAGDHFRKKFNLNVSGERYLKDSVMIDSTSPADPVGIWTKWVGTDPFSHEYKPLRKDQLSDSQIETIYTTIKKVMWCFNGNSSRFIMKMPGFIPYLPLLNDLFPDAKYIHLIRDPRQCANSLVKLSKLSSEQLIDLKKKKKNYEHADKTFIPYPHLPNLSKYIYEHGVGHIKTAANVWNDALQFIENFKLEAGNFYDVRFEDILSNPLKEVFNIYDFCELPEIKSDNTEFWNKMSNVGKTHHKNTYGDFDIIEDICKETMERYGYETQAIGKLKVV